MCQSIPLLGKSRVVSSQQYYPTTRRSPTRTFFVVPPPSRLAAVQLLASRAEDIWTSTHHTSPSAFIQDQPSLSRRAPIRSSIHTRVWAFVCSSRENRIKTVGRESLRWALVYGCASLQSWRLGVHLVVGLLARTPIFQGMWAKRRVRRR